MMRVILHGANGAMGRVLASLLEKDEDASVVAGVDICIRGDEIFPMFTEIDKVDVEADAIIDFASVKAVDALLTFSRKKKIPAIICTTGLSKEQLEQVEVVSKEIALLRSANMSLGVNLLQKLVKDAARVLFVADFDIEVVEKHHRRKVDAPSGTALALADSVNDALGNRLSYVYDRSESHMAREKEIVGISSVRGGSIVGEHDVIFAGEDEVVTLSHTAYSRTIFAKGAIAAAKYIIGKPARLYTMSDVIEGA